MFGEIRRERELIHRYFYGTRFELRNSLLIGGKRTTNLNYTRKKLHIYHAVQVRFYFCFVGEMLRCDHLAESYTQECFSVVLFIILYDGVIFLV